MDEKRAVRISQLVHTPAWDELAEEMREADARAWNRILKAQQQGTNVDPLVLAQLRATSEAVRAFLAAPEKAAKLIERERIKQAAAADEFDFYPAGR